MSVYLRNQPIATDDLSVSQPILAANTNKSDDSFGIDHFQFSDLTTSNGFHKKVTLPGTGLATPAPAANFGDMYAVTTATITQPYWIRDGLATIFNMIPIKAFGSFTGGGGTINALNLTALNTSAGQYTLTIAANAVTGTSYSVLIGVGINALNPGRGSEYVIVSATSVQIAFRNHIGDVLANPDSFSVIILQA